MHSFHHYSLVTILTLFQGSLNTGELSTCLKYSDSRTCSVIESCAWDDYRYSSLSENPCGVTFVMDSSRSVGSSGWDNEKKFVSEMMETGISEGSPVGVVVFSKYAYQLWKFEDNQDRSVISEAVNNAGFIASTTYTRTAIETTLDLYNDSGEADIFGLPRLMMLITDGVPVPGLNQNPCLEYEDIRCTRSGNYTPCPIPLVQPYLDVAEATRIRLDEENVTVIIIGVGTQWSPEVLECLVDDPVTQIIKSDSFNGSDLDVIRAQTDTFLCPATIQIVISELRVNESKPSGFADDQAFVEVYNRGDPWDLAGQNLILKGFLNCTLTEGEWLNGQYLVIYDGLKANPICDPCECEFLEDNEDWCKDAIYVNASTIDGCVFDYSMSNQKWKQSGTDQNLVGSETYFDVTYDEIDGDGFEDGSVGVIDGFTYTVKRYFRSLQSARNWQPSCTEFGTPGAPPILNCSITCFPESCAANGDTGGECSSNNRYCLCTAEEHYYPSGTRCLNLPPPQNCRIFTSKFNQSDDNLTEWNNRAIWDPAPTDDSHQYQFEYTVDGKKLVMELEKVTADYYESMPLNYDTPQVRTRLFTQNEWYYSEWLTCVWITESPTTAPTMSPTHTYPDVDCEVEVVPGETNEFKVMWDQVNLTGPLTPSDDSSFYRIYSFFEGELFSTQDVNRLNGPENSAQRYQYIYPFGNDVDITDPLSQVAFTMIYERLDMDGYVWTNDDLRNAAVNCTLFSEAPTVNPTGSPSAYPSSLTEPPSFSPTMTPISSIFVKNCTYQMNGIGFDMIFEEPQFRDEPFSNDPSLYEMDSVQYVFEWDEPQSLRVGYPVESNADWFGSLNSEITLQSTLTVQVSKKADISERLGQRVVCEFTSLAPTMAPVPPFSDSLSRKKEADPLGFILIICASVIMVVAFGVLCARNIQNGGFSSLLNSDAAAMEDHSQAQQSIAMSEEVEKEQSRIRKSLWDKETDPGSSEPSMKKPLGESDLMEGGMHPSIHEGGSPEQLTPDLSVSMIEEGATPGYTSAEGEKVANTDGVDSGDESAFLE